MYRRRALALTLCVTAASASAAFSQVKTDAPAPVAGAKPAIVERVKIKGAGLEGNLEGNAAERDVLVFLPPGYQREKARRYPVVYALHGYSIGAEQWVKEIQVPQTIEGAFAGGAREMIVVLPDSKTVHNGSRRSISISLLGDIRDNVLARWAANAPLAFVDQYIHDLRQYRAIAIDVGDQDGLKNDASRLHDVLNSYGIANTFDVYAGNHTNRVAVRFQDVVVPFFSRTLSFEVAK